MSTTRTRRTRKPLPETSEGILHYLSDGLFGRAPDPGRDFKLYSIRRQPEKIRECWNQHKDAILEEWIEQWPGTRPALWWRFDAPRVRQNESESVYLKRHGLLTAFERRRLLRSRKKV